MPFGLWEHSASISNFNSLFELSFASNLAYTVLVRTGLLQGSSLTAYCNRQARHADEALKLVKAEAPEYGSIDLEAKRLVCDGLVPEATNKIDKLVPWFSALAISMAMVSLVWLFASAAWPNYLFEVYLLWGVVFIAFLPIPAALIWTYVLVISYEKKIDKEFENVFTAIDVFRKKPREETKKSIQVIRQKMNGRRPSVIFRLITWGKHPRSGIDS